MLWSRHSSITLPLIVQISPEVIRGMLSIECLVLNDNKLTGPVPISELTGLVSIRSILLGNNDFVNPDVTERQINSHFEAARKSVEVDITGRQISLSGNDGR